MPETPADDNGDAENASPKYTKAEAEAALAAINASLRELRSSAI
jgi:hypothetical protein